MFLKPTFDFSRFCDKIVRVRPLHHVVVIACRREISGRLIVDIFKFHRYFLTVYRLHQPPGCIDLQLPWELIVAQGRRPFGTLLSSDGVVPFFDSGRC